MTIQATEAEIIIPVKDAIALYRLGLMDGALLANVLAWFKTGAFRVTLSRQNKPSSNDD